MRHVVVEGATRRNNTFFSAVESTNTELWREESVGKLCKSNSYIELREFSVCSGKWRACEMPALDVCLKVADDLRARTQLRCGK